MVGGQGVVSICESEPDTQLYLLSLQRLRLAYLTDNTSFDLKYTYLLRFTLILKHLFFLFFFSPELIYKEVMDLEERTKNGVIRGQPSPLGWLQYRPVVVVIVIYLC